MNPYFIKVSFLFILASISFLSSAQQSALGTPTIYPLQPNSNDSIIVITEVGSPTTPCALDSFSVNIIDSTITIDAYYRKGFAQGSCLSKDTIALGQLLPKRYILKYNAIDNYVPFASVSDSIYFTVNQAIGISERNNPIESISVFPNPSKEAINLKVQLDRAVFASFRITDIQGRNVYAEKVQLSQGESLHKLETKKLESGTYILSLWDAEKLLTEEKIIIQQ